ncbi:putative aspartic-type endopeptidase protein [Botrytis fragariae]|uniref:Putative aspartic-type endopeptidase protein n=1 Tax=Botrytis fragariae TaxID=1964551 RepID=A0A8H6B1D8_9HELO|nr:putative aspartic-type endopeptidase protein [Botrytis fragariae]KAF5877631.1 putative aspartic-type endopeptidase protein [Botrytis fragariae]
MAASKTLKSRAVSLILASLFIPLASAGSNAISLQWSNRSYGPDGPWQAVSIDIGTPTQAIDLLPGGTWTANILSTSICSNSSGCSASKAGLFDRHASTSYTQINNTGVIANTTFANRAGALPILSGAAYIGLDTLTISNGIDSDTIDNFELLVIENAVQTLSNGTAYAPQVGTLALGAPDINQTFSSNLTGQFLSSGLYSHARIPSNSFGLHIGSASMGIPGSLVLGGYDQSRVLTPVTTQKGYNGTFPMSLVDISIDTIDGYSPLNFNTTKSGLLFNNSTSAASNGLLAVNVDPSVPYLYLPTSACDILASFLPITYNENLDLYLWNTTSPLYKPIISSPTYLAFTFSNPDSENQNTQTSIKIPFSLLSLSLTNPLSNASDSVPYFPCQPSPLPSGSWALGRAFLQAAFLGTVWTGSSNITSSQGIAFFLAQAPGPGIPDEKLVDLQPESTSLNASTTIWKDTWSSHWTPLTTPLDLFSSSFPSSQFSAPSSSSSSSNTGLPTAQMVGISVGSATAFIFLLAVIFWICRRKANIARANKEKEKEEAISREMEKKERERQGIDLGWIKLEDDP